MFILESLLIGLIVGALSWYSTNRIGKPFIEYHRVKKEVCYNLVYYGPILKLSSTNDDARKSHNQKVEDRCDKNKNNAAEIVAAYNNIPKYLRRIVNKQENITKIRRNLIGMSNVYKAGERNAAYLKMYSEELVKLLNIRSV